MSHDESREAALRIESLSICLPDGRPLLQDVALTVERGEFVLLVGPSGAGKSTLLKLISGLGDGESQLSAEGVIEVVDSGDARSAAPRVGMVFQNLALFDELTTTENVQFAIDHSGAEGRKSREEAVKRLAEMAVPVDAKIRNLSGGERQRVAVARTLAMDPPLLLFDEPTTGLDPYRARAVADLIAQTHATSGKTTIVVTHDYEPFLKYKPRVALIDPQSRTIRDVTGAELEQFFEGPPPDVERDLSAGPSAAPIAHAEYAWLTQPGEVVVTLLMAAVMPFASWSRARWKLRYLWHFARIVVFGSTLLYVAIAGAMIGFVTVFFSFSQIPYEQITVPLLNEEFLSATGFSTYRVLVPLLIGVLVACKCGAAIAADVGARRLTHQFEAMKSFGARPASYLYGNIVIALALGTPILTIAAFLANRYASLVAYIMSSEQATMAVFNRNFMATVWPGRTMVPTGTGWLAAKMVTCGLLIAAIAYAVGGREKSSSVDVSRDVGRTIFWASLCVLAAHSVFAFVEF